jgi:CRISPR-associated exonuclease Cas4
MIILPIIGLFILAILLFWLSSRQRKQAGLPGGRVIYTDTRAWNEVEKPLYDPQLGLTGKPDYLVEQGGQIIPVEVKSGRAPSAPYDSHIFQLAAYCLLVHRTTGRRPPYGILHYPGRDFAVDYSPELESQLLEILAEMRRDEMRTQVMRSHESAARCSRCGFRVACDQRLGETASGPL